MSMLFISHDLSVVQEMSDRIIVIYLGRVVELADSVTICQQPQHPYTQALIAAVPIPDPLIERQRQRQAQSHRLPGELPSPTDPKAALRFLPSKLAAGMFDYVPILNEVKPGHFVADHDSLEMILGVTNADL